MHMINLNYKSGMLGALSAIGICAALGGCGGGGSGNASEPVAPTPTPTTPTLLPTANLQGIWNGSVGSDTASAVVLSDGKAWLIVNSTPVKLYNAALLGSSSGYSASAQQFSSGSTAAPASVSIVATPTAKSALTGTITPAGGLPVTYSLTYQTRYESAAVMTDITGTWQGTQAASTLAVQWVISASGAVTQGVSNSNGCTYTGLVAVHAVPAPVGVFDLSLTETCGALGVAVVKDFTGVVTLNAAKTAATFAFVRSDTGHAGLEGYVLPALKQ